MRHCRRLVPLHLGKQGLYREPKVFGISALCKIRNGIAAIGGTPTHERRGGPEQNAKGQPSCRWSRLKKWMSHFVIGSCTNELSKRTIAFCYILFYSTRFCASTCFMSFSNQIVYNEEQIWFIREQWNPVAIPNEINPSFSTRGLI